MKTRFFSAMLAAFMLATASVGGVTASAAEKTVAEEEQQRLLRSMMRKIPRRLRKQRLLSLRTKALLQR